MKKRYFIKAWDELLATEGAEIIEAGYIRKHNDSGQFTESMKKICGIELSNCNFQYFEGWNIHSWMIKEVIEDELKEELGKKYIEFGEALISYDNTKRRLDFCSGEVERLAKELGIDLSVLK